MNICANDEHVPERKGTYKQLKQECKQFPQHYLNRYPPCLIVEMVYNCGFWLKSFTDCDGVHTTMSPGKIMTGKRINYNKHCRVQIWMHIQVHKKHDNSMQPRTSGATTRPSGNKQGRASWFVVFNLHVQECHSLPWIFFILRQLCKNMMEQLPFNSA